MGPGEPVGWVAERSKAPVLKTGDSGRNPGVRIPPHPPLQSLGGHRVSAAFSDQPWQQPGLRSPDPDLTSGGPDTPGTGAQVVAAIAAAFKIKALAGGAGGLAQHGQRHGFLPRVLEHGPGPAGIGPGLIADGLEAFDTIFPRRVVQIACLDSIMEVLEVQFRFSGALGSVEAEAVMSGLLGKRGGAERSGGIRIRRPGYRSRQLP